MKTIKKECKNCKKEFDALLKEVNRGNANFCSQSCSSKYKKIWYALKVEPNIICETCKKAVYKNTSKLKNSKHKKYFCSRKCKDQGQRIGGVKEIQPPHYGNGFYVDYRELAFEYYENKCSNCGYNKFKSILEVHHIDRDRTNNKIENLKILCSNCHRENHLLNNDGLFWNTKVGYGAAQGGHLICNQDIQIGAVPI